MTLLDKKTGSDVEALADEYSTRSPQDILKLALDRFENISISFSGAEDVVLVDMACQMRSDVSVFTLDTGRLHSETYHLIEKVREQYPISLNVIFPDTEQVQTLVQAKGLFSFYKDGHKECCSAGQRNNAGGFGPVGQLLRW